ncbi:hypothetical protein [Bacillus sp. AFS088145]|uniref:hypothetical protein n=1 Tax=Bacillus sp. AFS088145 TaxID=2033514 RepID=UPI000BFA0AE4|nr:hypothetical protein [Bacillus sp. AFS088145]PFH85614.1 hypothetical protein COI44_13405 [Bacillus sp. AFS088145]
MEKKSMKKKIAVGILAAGILTSSSLAFASTNAGELFTNYAAQLLNDAKSTVSNTLGSKTSDMIGALKNKLNAYASDTENGVNNKQGELQQAGVNKINGQSDEHINAINNALPGINQNTTDQFSQLVAQLNAQTTAGVEGEVNGLKPDFSSQVTNRQQKITAEQAKALNDLEDAINAAKVTLGQLIDLQKQTADQQVKTYLQDQIDKVTQIINDATSDLEFKKSKALATKATNIKNDTLNDLDSLASGLYTPQNSYLADFESASSPFTIAGGWERINSKVDGKADYYLISNNVSNNSSSTAEVTINVPDNAYNAFLSFDYLVLSQLNKDILTISLDGSVLVSESGTDNHWTNKKLTIQPGKHVLKLTYAKDKSGSSSKDAGYIDNISLKYDLRK